MFASHLGADLALRRFEQLINAESITIGAEMAEILELACRTVDSATVLTVNGRVDMATSDALRDSLLNALAGGLPLIIDLGGVDYISSAGLRALMLASKQARSTGTTLLVAALQPVVLEIFQISRFDKLLPCHATVDLALATGKAA